MLLFRSDLFGGKHELLPCGLLGGDLVKLFRKSKSKYYWYDFTVRGERYRGSTKENNETRAQKVASLKLAATIKGSNPLDRKRPTLREYSEDSFQWVDGTARGRQSAARGPGLIVPSQPQRWCPRSLVRRGGGTGDGAAHLLSFEDLGHPPALRTLRHRPPRPGNSHSNPPAEQYAALRCSGCPRAITIEKMHSCA